MKPTAREIKKAIRLENEAREKQKAIAAKKIAKLEPLTIDRGATPAEAENARAKVDALPSKPRPQGKYDPPPLAQTVEDLLARRKGRLKPQPTQPSESTDEVTQLRAEVARLTAEVAWLTRELVEAKATMGADPAPIGDRPMTAAERMRRMRSRNSLASS